MLILNIWITISSCQIFFANSNVKLTLWKCFCSNGTPIFTYTTDYERVTSRKQSTCLGCFLTEDKVFTGWRHFQDQCEIFISVDLCSCVGSVWSTTMQTSAMPPVFPLSVFNSPKFHPLSGHILNKHSAPHFSLAHNYLTKCLTSMLKPTAVTALFLIFTLYCCYQRLLANRQIILKCTGSWHSLNSTVWNLHLALLIFYDLFMNQGDVLWAQCIHRQLPEV